MLTFYLGNISLWYSLGWVNLIQAVRPLDLIKFQRKRISSGADGGVVPIFFSLTLIYIAAHENL